MTAPASPQGASRATIRRCLQATLLFLPLVLLPDGFQFAHYPKILVLQISLVILVALTLGQGPSRTSTGILLLLAWTLVQTFRSLNPWSASLLLATQVGAMGVGLVVASRTRPEDDDGLLRAMVWGGGLMALVGLLEYAGLVWLPSAGRPSATMGFRNVAAASIPAAFCLSTRRNNDRLVGIVALGVTALFVVYARSRGAYLAVGVAALYGGVVGLRSGFPRVSRLASPLVVLIFVAVLSGVSPRYDDPSATCIDEKNRPSCALFGPLSKRGAIAIDGRSGGIRGL